MSAQEGESDMGRCDRIQGALATTGGHLLVAEGGWTLHFASGAKLHGHDLEAMRARCADAGLPVIDCSRVRFTGRLRSCLDWPPIAVGEPPGRHCWPLVPMPLAQAAAIYRAEGAEVLNLDLDGPGPDAPMAPGPPDGDPGPGRHACSR